ncbi:MAG: DUF1828 domain-containing protein, partial [Epsilonproteobacteria bacterium]|nr:DUF1828 domain-containing protein [Campylobacterota bacterium]
NIIDIEYLKLSNNQSIIKFTLPLLDNSNDYVEIFLAKVDTKKWLFSDFGRIFESLLTNNINIRQFPYNKLFRNIANSYDILFNPRDNSILKKISLSDTKNDKYILKGAFVDFINAIRRLYDLHSSLDILEILSDNLKYNIEYTNQKDKCFAQNYIFHKANISQNKIVIQNFNITFVFGLKKTKYNKIQKELKQFISTQIAEYIQNTDNTDIKSIIEDYVENEILKKLDFKPSKSYISIHKG